MDFRNTCFLVLASDFSQEKGIQFDTAEWKLLEDFADWIEKYFGICGYGD